jgi:hypothetical protein
MTRRFIFVVLCLATASGALGQSVRPAAAKIPGPRPIARTQGRKILATIPPAAAESKSETDCSHLVHDVYERAGFPCDYVSSRELYLSSSAEITEGFRRLASHTHLKEFSKAYALVAEKETTTCPTF